MIRKAVNRHVPPVHTDDACDAADVDFVLMQQAALADEVQVFFGEQASERGAADGSAFFVLKEDDFQRMPQARVVFRERLRDFNCTGTGKSSVVWGLAVTPHAPIMKLPNGSAIWRG